MWSDRVVVDTPDEIACASMKVKSHFLYINGEILGYLLNMIEHKAILNASSLQTQELMHNTNINFK